MAAEEADSIWYFAIGAMVNPVSLGNRNIFPLVSRPAALLDHNIHFFGSIGVAEAVVERGASFHGVLHKLDVATMEQLDKIERDYVKKTATARCYDGTLIECLVYCRPHSLSTGRSAEADADADAADTVPEPDIVERVDRIAAEEPEAELGSPRHRESIVQSRARKGRRVSLCLSDLRIKESVSDGSRASRVASASSLPSYRRLSLENIDMGAFAIPPCGLEHDNGDGEESSSGSDNTPTPAKHTPSCSDQPPLERYLNIMIDGCQHFGVSEEYIEFLRNHESQPRPTAGEFYSFGEPPEGAPTYTLQEVEQCDGRDGRPLRITFCGRVLECSLDRNSQDWTEFVEIHEQVGHVGELYISKVAYDPKYGVPELLEDFTQEHANYLEDLMW
eukprot:CAMPEP_0181044510 /NCGR_PEP_ID=MMETSP1070-20121207/13305_1 /TAXON_ID=265543 /ORGANISM="Minutocellus polymorphus, Strain NH13" /LENGTH=389 /DNA_ID=CAMNT_0023122961 /DNA_START=180 /DNA_END=1346 /DNA_ORIENTATION=-